MFYCSLTSCNHLARLENISIHPIKKYIVYDHLVCISIFLLLCPLCFFFRARCLLQTSSYVRICHFCVHRNYYFEQLHSCQALIVYLIFPIAVSNNNSSRPALARPFADECLNKCVSAVLRKFNMVEDKHAQMVHSVSSLLHINLNSNLII